MTDHIEIKNELKAKNIIKYPNIKLIKKTEPIKQIYSTFIEEFLSMKPEYLNKWLEFDNQNEFRKLIADKNFKMKNPKNEEEEKQKKVEKKVKRDSRAREIHEYKVKKDMEKPKQPYYYFLQDEKENIRKRLIEEGNTVNKIIKKLIHVEAQNIWKELNNSKNSEDQERLKKYKQIADKKKVEADVKVKELLDAGVICECCKNNIK